MGVSSYLLHAIDAGPGAEDGWAVVDSLRAPVLVVDRRLRLRFANAAGKALIEQGEAVTLRYGIIRTTRAADAPRLRRWLASAPSTTAPLTLHDDENRPAWVLDLLPSTGTSGTAALIFTQVAREPATHPRRLQATLGLTPAQSRLAMLLAADATVAEAADELGITRGTARNVLKKIFAKVGVRRQAELVRLVARLEPPIDGETD